MVNSPAVESFPQILGDNRTLLFVRGYRLFVAAPSAEGWMTAIELPDQLKDCRDSWMSPDGQRLYFAASSASSENGARLLLTRRVPKASTAGSRIP